MQDFSLRRALAGLFATLVAIAAIVVGAASPAHAAAGASFHVKTAGTHYTASRELALGLVPGADSTSISVKVVNTGTTYQHFKVTYDGSDGSLSASLRAGSKYLPQPYYTPPLQPGESITLTLGVQVIASDSVPNHWMSMEMRDPATNAVLDDLFVHIMSTRQTGHLRNDLFLKTGAQPYVGGSVSQAQSAAAIKVGASATFTVRLKNNGATSVPAIRLSRTLSGFCPSNYVLTVKKGVTDVTAAVANGTFSTGPLAPGAKVDLKATIKRTGTAPNCDAGHVLFNAFGPDGQVQQGAHAPNAV